MKKFLPVIAAAVLLAAAAAVAPYFLGKRIENVYRNEVAALSMPGSFTAEVAEYKRGWSTSEAKVLLTLVVPDSAMSADPEIAQEVGKLTRFVVQDVIHHGPFPFAGFFADESSPLVALAVVDSALFFQEEPFLFAQFFGQSALVTARTAVDFGGGLAGRVVGQKLTYKAPDGTFDIDWKGFDGRYTYTGNRLAGKASGGGLDLGSPENRFRLFPYATEFDYVRHASGTFVGSQSVRFDGAEATLMKQSVGGMKNFAYKAKTDMEGNLLKGEGEATIESVTLSGGSYGPGRLVMRLDKLDMPSYLRFNESIQTAVKKLLDAASRGEDLSPPPDPITFLDEDGKKALGELLKTSPVVEIPEVSLRTPDGEISGRMLVTFQGGKPAPVKLADLVRQLVFDFRLRVPYGMAKKIAAAEAKQEAMIELLRNNPNEFPDPKEVDRMAEYLAARTLQSVHRKGILKREGDFFVIEGGMKEGRFTLNGKEYHVPLD